MSQFLQHKLWFACWIINIVQSLIRSKCLSTQFLRDSSSQISFLACFFSFLLSLIKPIYPQYRVVIVFHNHFIFPTPLLLNFLPSSIIFFLNCAICLLSASVFHETFKRLRHIQPEVLYPIPDFSAFSKPVDPPTPELMPVQAKTMFLSINRYERKKNLQLALYAFGKDNKFFTSSSV